KAFRKLVLYSTVKDPGYVHEKIGIDRKGVK
ncbi:MAG: hypothetical protein JG777_3044, partial [Clostridia bacterium]|nr:hypothetical protein [Clostridia bacterium]